MTNTSGRVESTRNEDGKVRITVRRIALMTKCSMLLIAAATLVACGAIERIRRCRSDQCPECRRRYAGRCDDRGDRGRADRRRGDAGIERRGG